MLSSLVENPDIRNGPLHRRLIFLLSSSMKSGGIVGGGGKRQRRRQLWFYSTTTKPSLECVLVVFVVISNMLMLFSFYWFDFTTERRSIEGGGEGGRGGGGREMIQKSNDRINYGYWRHVAVNLARMPPGSLLQTLERKDPFEVRTFEQRLLEQETQQGRILTLSEIRQLFPCPTIATRIAIPNQRNETRAQEFRNGHGFLFFQHLRKAGGTNFCELAKHNLPRPTVPKYYCMPDMHWPNTPGAGYLHTWTNAQIIEQYEQEHYRVAGNEWDTFDRIHHWELPAVFATSFRRPLERALSQFRFECLEDRGCKIKNVTQWWERRRDLANVYVRTFADVKSFGLLKTYRGTTTSDATKRAQLLGQALDTIIKFNLITIMEWLAYAGPQVTDVLGFQDTSQLTKRVRPHIGQAPRDDGPNRNVLGARGVIESNNGSNNNSKNNNKMNNKSWKSTEMLVPDLHRQMSEDLALDEILTDAARRIFLEHLVCDVQKVTSSQ